ncbi:MAG: hypothetical protein H5T99_14310 [Moorella sp. (in: Bacteria)]|nr:hypothetical protein [Moorella sp. (in: firmicutes)]
MENVLSKAFDARETKALVQVLDWVVKTRDEAMKEGMRKIEAAIQRLAEAQARTEEAVRKLEEAQARTEEAVRKLAEAQARTEERVSGLEAAMQKLAEAQAKADERLTGLEAAMQKLAEAQARTDKALQKLARQVGGLSDTVGGDIEDIAYIVLHDVLKREYGWQVGVLERTWQTWDKKPEEVNVFGKAVDPARPEQPIWIIGEAKHNLTLKEVERFARQVERARRHLKGEIFPVCFCYRARPEVQEMIRKAGLRLVFSYGRLA